MKVIILKNLIMAAASVAALVSPVHAEMKIEIQPASYDNSDVSKDDLFCLTQNIYHEARGEGYMGMFGVAQVTMNRVSSKRFPNSVCGVVRQAVYKDGQPVRNKCQFSWWCDGKSDKMHSTKAREQAKQVAMDILMTYENPDIPDMTNGALFYHTPAVSPRWSKVFSVTTIIGNHIYYDGVRK